VGAVGFRSVVGARYLGHEQLSLMEPHVLRTLSGDLASMFRKSYPDRPSAPHSSLIAPTFSCPLKPTRLWPVPELRALPASRGKASLPLRAPTNRASRLAERRVTPGRERMELEMLPTLPPLGVIAHPQACRSAAQPDPTQCRHQRTGPVRGPARNSLRGLVQQRVQQPGRPAATGRDPRHRVAASVEFNPGC
jgi:hypothetical protein